MCFPPLWEEGKPLSLHQGTANCMYQLKPKFTYMCVCVHACTCVQVTGKPPVSSLGTLPTSFETMSLIGLKLMDRLV